MDTDSIQEKNPPAGRGNTPLHEAAEMGHYEICQLILDQESIQEKNPAANDGFTPLHLAATYGRGRPESYLKICKAILDIVEEKAPLTERGETPLQLAERSHGTDSRHSRLIRSYLE